MSVSRDSVLSSGGGLVKSATAGQKSVQTGWVYPRSLPGPGFLGSGRAKDGGDFWSSNRV